MCWRVGCRPLSRRLYLFLHGPEVICRWSFVGLRPFVSGDLGAFFDSMWAPGRLPARYWIVVTGPEANTSGFFQVCYGCEVSLFSFAFCLYMGLCPEFRSRDEVLPRNYLSRVVRQFAFLPSDRTCNRFPAVRYRSCYRSDRKRITQGFSAYFFLKSTSIDDAQMTADRYLER